MGCARDRALQAKGWQNGSRRMNERLADDEDLYITCYMCDCMAHMAKVIDYFGLRKLVNFVIPSLTFVDSLVAALSNSSI